MTMSNEDDDILAEIAATLGNERLITSKLGRKAKLTRTQVDEILLSNDMAINLAVRFDVSVSTIVRARRHQYVTADEQGHHKYRKTRQGRKLATGDQLDDDTRAKIAADPSPALNVAKVYGVSRSYVYHLRTQYGTNDMTGRRGPLPPEAIQEIRKSELDDAELAQILDLSVAVVRAVRGQHG
jgi:plasmid maintenance system antidote protein VapI